MKIGVKPTVMVCCFFGFYLEAENEGHIYIYIYITHSLVYKGKVHHFFSQVQELPLKKIKNPTNLNIL